MSRTTKSEAFIKFEQGDVIDAGKSLIAASSILVACSDQYANTGQLSVGALVHAANVVDRVIERLKLAELIIETQEMPF